MTPLPESPMAADLKRTPLHDAHMALGAKMVPFAGWEMPVQYPAGILAEHKAVRTGTGIFDVSHMGEFEVSGPDRNAFVNRLTCNDVGALDPGGVQYSALLTPEGTFVDDCTVYRFDDRLMLVVNAANRARAWEHVVDQKQAWGVNVRLRDISDDTGLLAVQGPKAKTLLQPLTGLPLSSIGYYRGAAGRIAGLDCFISRTGYTGEDGFELYCRWRDTVALWAALTGAGGRPPRRGAPGAAPAPRRPGPPGLAPARDGLRALRPGDRRHHHAARGRVRVDRQARQGFPLPRIAGAPGPEGRRGHPEDGGLPARRPGDRAARLSGLVRRQGGGPGAERRPVAVAGLRHRHAHAPRRRGEARNEVRGRLSRRAHGRPGGGPSVLEARQCP